MRKLITGGSILIFWVLMIGFTNHAIYISFISVTITDDPEIEIEFRIFYDDLNDAIHDQEHKRFSATNLTDLEYRLAIQSYLEKHFTIGESKNYIQIKTLAKEGEAIFIKATITLQNLPKQNLLIRSDILTDLFPDQKNIVQIDFRGKSFHKSLDRKTKEANFSI